MDEFNRFLQSCEAKCPTEYYAAKMMNATLDKLGKSTEEKQIIKNLQQIVVDDINRNNADPCEEFRVYSLAVGMALQHS